MLLFDSLYINFQSRLVGEQSKHQQLEQLQRSFAKKASEFNSWLQNAEEDLTDPVRVNSLEESKRSKATHERFFASLTTQQQELQGIADMDEGIKATTHAKNPYTWFTVDVLQDAWVNLGGFPHVMRSMRRAKALAPWVLFLVF